MLNVDRLLKKKSWTGAELGKLQIANVLLAYKKALETGDPNEEGVVSKAEFKKMLNTITDPIERRVYNGYMAIHEWIAHTMQMAIAQEQQAQLQFETLWEILSNVITAEDIYSYIEELPVIMTEKQYTDLVEKRTHEILHTDEDRVADNIAQLVFDVIEVYTELLEKDPEAKNPLQPLKKKLEKELVKDPNILENYNRIYGLDHYTTKDGEREDLNKWEILTSGALEEFYPCFEDGHTDEEAIELIKAFYIEFKEVVHAILKDIVKRYPELKAIEELPVEEWIYNAYSWEELYNMDFYHFKERMVGDLQVFDCNKRALTNGIAIIRPSELGSSRRIDAETGYYKAPDIRKTLKDISLEGLFTEGDRYTENVDRVEDARETFIASLYFLKAFNEALNLISTLFDVEEVNIIKRNIPHFENRVQAFNDTIAMLYKRILNTEYGDNELKEKKLGVLKDILYPIDLSKAKVPKDRIDRTKEYMKDFKAFKEDRYSPTNTLCVYIPDYEEEILDTDEDGEGGSIAYDK